MEISSIRVKPHLIFTICLLMLALHLQYAFAQKETVDYDAIRYGSESYDKEREITYWGQAHFSVSDYESGSGDAEYLKLTEKDANLLRERAPSQDLQKHFLGGFKKYFGDLPFNDLEKGWRERYEKFFEQDKGDTGKDRFDRFEAAEEARRRALYGGRAGAIYCHVQVKRRAFPILYEIRCSLSAELRYESWREKKDIGFSSPEHIAGEIKQAITQKLKEMSDEMEKIRKYRKAK